jgi:hypothetical protein
LDFTENRVWKKGSEQECGGILAKVGLQGETLSVDWRVETRRVDQNSRLAGLPVYQQEIDEKAKTLKLWVRRKRGNQKLICAGCGARIAEAAEVTERKYVTCHVLSTAPQ